MVRPASWMLSCCSRRCRSGSWLPDGEVDVAGAADKVARSWELMLSKLARNGQHRPYSHSPYSHSMVPGGLLVISITTRFTPFTSLTMRLEIFSIRS